MNDWNRYVKKWFNTSYIAHLDDEFDIIEQELDRIFKDDFNEVFSESYIGIRNGIAGKEVDARLYGFCPVNLRSNTKTRTRKVKRNVKRASAQKHNHINSYYYSITDEFDITRPILTPSRIGKEGKEPLDDIILTDKTVKVVSQLSINNRREDIKLVAHDNNSVTVSYLSSEGKRCRRTLVLPYNIDIENARSTYRNGILEITFSRK